MNHAKCIAVFLVGCLCAVEGGAQHCAGITESYLSLVSLKQKDESIQVAVEYQKQGGRQKEAYQAYLLAYLAKRAGRIPLEAPQDTIDTSEMVILHTQLIKRSEEGNYDMKFKTSSKEFVKSLVTHGLLTEPTDRVAAAAGFYDSDDKIRLAIFIPFLEDEKYSVLEGLPEDRHECNYSNERALLFQPLPYLLTVRRFVSRPVCSIVINSDQREKVAE